MTVQNRLLGVLLRMLNEESESTNKNPFPYSSLGCSNFGEQKPKPNFELQIKLSLTMNPMSYK